MTENEYDELIYPLVPTSLTNPKETGSSVVLLDAFLDTGASVNIVSVRAMKMLIWSRVIKQSDIIMMTYKTRLSGLDASLDQAVVLKVSVYDQAPIDLVFLIAEIENELVIGVGGLYRLGITLAMKPWSIWPHTPLEQHAKYPDFKNMYEKAKIAFLDADTHSRDGSLDSITLSWRAVRAFIELIAKKDEFFRSVATTISRDQIQLRATFKRPPYTCLAVDFKKLFNTWTKVTLIILVLMTSRI